MESLIKYLPFAELSKNGLDYWKRAKKNEYYDFREVQTTFVSVYDLREKARTHELYKSDDIFPPSVWQGTPGFMSRSWVNNNRGKKEYNYKFGTGLYKSTTGLLLVDDLFEWVHGRIETKQVRTALDIIIAIQKGEF